MRHAVEEIIDFTAEQAIKTVRRPSRLIRIPYKFVRPMLLRIAHVCFQIVIRCADWLGIPDHWVLRHFAAVEAEYQYLRGQHLLDENKPEQAWRAFSECLRYSKDYFHFKIAATCLYGGLGRMREAIELFDQSNRIRCAQKLTLGASEYDKYCLLDDVWARYIGHASQIDYVVKLRALDGHNSKETILYEPWFDSLPNRFLVEQWKPHLRLVTDPRELPFPEDYVKCLALDFFVPGVTGVGKYYLWNLAAKTYRRWAEEGRKPLLRLAEDVQERGRNALASVGVPRDAWFVGLHVREPYFHRHHRELTGVLNAKTEDYLPAIDEIVRRGGWVIRMGDPSMSLLPSLPNVFDYCHSAIRSDWMDVFLAANSRFFIGTSSGFCYVPQNYGVPCVLTNWWPPAQRPWHSGDIFVPKLLRRMGDGRVLSLEESLNEPFGYCNSKNYLQEKHGVTVHDNHPQDICAAVVEMIERMDGRPNYDKSDLAIRERAEQIYASVAMKLYDSPAAFGAGALARDLLRRNPSFLAT